MQSVCPHNLPRLPAPSSLADRAGRLAFTVPELVTVIAIIALIVSIGVPSLTRVSRDIQVSHARSAITGALVAARARAIRDRQPVALHVFRDNEAYRGNTNRWPDPDPARVHVPTGKMTLRLEVPNPAHVTAGSETIGFIWPADHEPIVLPESLGVCRPDTILFDPADNSVTGRNGQYVDVSYDFGGTTLGAYRLAFYEDFYIVFSEDGKLVNMLVDYNVNAATGVQRISNIAPIPAADMNVVSSANNLRIGKTWSATGLSVYETATFKSLPEYYNETFPLPPGQPLNCRCAYVNAPDNRILVSPYTGLALSMEPNK